MTDLLPHMRPDERARYAKLQALVDRGDEARAEMTRIRRAVTMRIRRKLAKEGKK